MITIYELLEWKWNQTRQPISFCEHLERIKEQLTCEPIKKRVRPAEALSFNQWRRLMGDVGPRQFLKERGNRCK